MVEMGSREVKSSSQHRGEILRLMVQKDSEMFDRYSEY